jgi:hypothetical protein
MPGAGPEAGANRVCDVPARAMRHAWRAAATCVLSGVFGDDFQERGTVAVELGVADARNPRHFGA